MVSDPGVFLMLALVCAFILSIYFYGSPPV
jgi:hypothetical protein